MTLLCPAPLSPVPFTEQPGPQSAFTLVTTPTDVIPRVLSHLENRAGLISLSAFSRTCKTFHACSEPFLRPAEWASAYLESAADRDDRPLRLAETVKIQKRFGDRVSEDSWTLHLATLNEKKKDDNLFMDLAWFAIGEHASDRQEKASTRLRESALLQRGRLNLLLNAFAAELSNDTSLVATTFDGCRTYIDQTSRNTASPGQRPRADSSNVQLLQSLRSLSVAARLALMNEWAGKGAVADGAASKQFVTLVHVLFDQRYNKHLELPDLAPHKEQVFAALDHAIAMIARDKSACNHSCLHDFGQALALLPQRRWIDNQPGHCNWVFALVVLVGQVPAGLGVKQIDVLGAQLREAEFFSAHEWDALLHVLVNKGAGTITTEQLTSMLRQLPDDPLQANPYALS
ncbi:MAG: hypothetical protein JWP36_2231 [Paucimonas sp.]|nr:hypothetical protein [Paucimonas sp.]